MTVRTHPMARLALLLGTLVVLYAVRYSPSEPFFNNDETRHVMTGVFVRDFLAEMPLSDVKGFAVRYYLQYPALGLLVWPPLFYAIEGLWMTVLGPSVLVAKLLVGAFALVACGYFYAMVRREIGERAALVSVALFAVSPMIVTHSSQVMLEIPALAAALAALYHFTRYVDEGTPRQLACTAFATACALLIRFDTAFLAPTFAIVIVARRQLRLLWRWGPWIAVGTVAMVVGPIWWLTAREIGWVHLQSIRQATESGAPRVSEALLYYPFSSPLQVGWWVLAPACLGLLVAARQGAARFVPFFALLIGVYITMTPIAERDPRHAIWWIPAIAVFAATGCELASRWLRAPALHVALVVAVVGATGWSTLRRPAPYIDGYGEAADYVLANSRSRFCLFDSLLNGNFIYQMRIRDSAGRMSVLRGDKLFYAVVSDPRVAYKEFVADDDELLRVIHRYDPEFIVVEDPQIRFKMPMADRLLALLRTRPDRFRLERQIAIRSSMPAFKGSELRVYRSLVRNPQPVAAVELPAFGMADILPGVE